MNQNKSGDPIGAAIKEYAVSKKPADIIVKSDICDDDIIPIEVLFRKFSEMPDLEKKAISKCKGSILDVGAGAGAHAIQLLDNGHQVTCIEISKGAVDHLKSIGLNAQLENFFDFNSAKFDTILMLMNGLGLAGTLSNLEKTLLHAKELLNPGGKIICDSSDIKFLYEDDDGGLWTDLNSEYYGNFQFQMEYKKEVGATFDWLYVDFDNLFKAAQNVGLKAHKIFEQEDHYLAEITIE